MFCKNCGNNLDDNAVVCDRCGAPVSNGLDLGSNDGAKILSKKEFFKSYRATPSAQSMKSANTVILCVFAFIAIALIVVFALCTFIFAAYGDMFDFSEGLVNGLKNVEGVDTESIYTESQWALLEETEKAFEAENGMSFAEFWENLPILCVTYMIGNMAMLVVLLIAVNKINTGCAIAFLVLSVLFSGWIIIAGAIAVVVMTVKLNKEYEKYVANISVFADSGNEPDFT